jgi:rhamnose transport system ATP-binding protein
VNDRLAIVGLSKSFGGIAALRDVSFSIAPGSVHALLGENGAGKSTLVKIVTGVQPADSGTMSLDGAPIAFPSPLAARRRGVVAVYQDPKLFPHLDIAENIFMGSHPRSAIGLVDRPSMYKRARLLLDALDVDLDPRRSVMGLSIGETQYVEFARAMSVGDMRLLFLDEPTASLTPAETERLFGFVRRMRAQGTAVVFISHRLEELRDLVDRVTILRDGQHVLTAEAGALTERDIIKSMVGREADSLHRDVGERPPPGKVRLDVSGLSAKGEFEGIDFAVRAGEIVGIAGLVGAGRTEIALGIMGLMPKTGGTVKVDNQIIAHRTPKTMKRAGVVFVPEDRDAAGLLPGHSILTNLSLAILGAISRGPIISRSRERERVADLISLLQIKVGSVEDAASSLSGGNRQKLVIGKWLATSPTVFILDEPTHGIDVGTKAHIHTLMRELAQKGAAVVMISSDLPEIVAISDRILVIRRGRIAAQLERGATQEAVLAAASGSARLAA